jgi:hypothetical protein
MSNQTKDYKIGMCCLMNVLEHYCSINVRENRKTNQEWTIQKHRHQWGQATEGRQTKQKNKQQKKQTKKNKKQTNISFHGPIDYI